MTAGTIEQLAAPSPRFDPALLPGMPALDEVSRSLGPLHASVTGLVGLQHLFGSTATLLHRLAGRRIVPANVSLLGKPYSANPDVVDFLRNDLGFWTHPETLHQPSHRPNDAVMDERVHHVLDRVGRRLRQAKANGGGRVLLIDDGGRAIRILHSPRYDDIRSRFTCVEQTRCGIRTIADLDLEVPVINVAESWVKLEHESPLIATSVTEQLARQLRALAASGVNVGCRATVVGFGAIGAAVAEEMTRSGYEVSVHDQDADRRSQAGRAGYQVIRAEAAVWERGGVVVGCTGLPVLDKADHPRIADGTILISASSADVEFRAWQIRPGSRNLGILHCGRSDAGEIAGHPCFSLYRRGGFYLLNGGFPVNFDGGVDTIAPDRIQLTRCLLFLGGHQAARTFDPGLHRLEDGPQDMLVETLRSAAGYQAA